MHRFLVKCVCLLTLEVECLWSRIVLGTLFACSEKKSQTRGLKETETGEPVNENALDITNTSVSSTNCGGEPSEDILTATVEAGVVQVVHENYEESSCLSFGVDGVLDGTNLNVGYPKSGDECDCIDMYRLEYHIEGLEAGSYTLNAPGGVSADVVID